MTLKKVINYLFCWILFTLSLSANAQVSAIKRFSDLSRPEKCWVIRHPFILKNTWRVTQKVLTITDSIAATATLDGDKNGGQVDAFRHSYWIALLTQEIGWRKALALGRAHEKGNYIDFKKHRLEDGTNPDKASCDMDLFNNSVGSEIGKVNKNASGRDLQKLVIDAIIEGKMKIIKKDSTGNFLDANDKIIPADSLQGKWNNTKCLVNSDI